ncbi:MAG TPA: VWA domain-containing protein [Polyangiaceae bacterium]|nr:VWA domain-containing protein [Polyangiaceae bacterium]
MRFSHPWWLAGTALAAVVGAALVVGALLLIRASRRFGDDERVKALVTDNAAGRRALKGVLLVLAVAVAFVAAAQPQYGRGTRLVPATNLDVIIVLDYSKSMYARDVTPSRTLRAKTEVSRLIADLPGARFGAVAFAGEPISFPLTSDGGAIAQFFTQLSPIDMPVGGTAIARALEAALDLLHRDPLSPRHRRVIVLVTDGEDLEGDPVQVAEAAAKEHVTIHVVQIGGRTPEPIPDVDDNGNVHGIRKGDDGAPLTTSLSASGEEQLTKIAQTTGGNIVRSERGSTGISDIAAAMKTMMTEELSERVETVYADVYFYPTLLAVLLLVVEAFVPESPSRARERAKDALRKAAVGAGVTALVLLLFGCNDGTFVRHSPVVDDALKSYDAGKAPEAAKLLETYLSTGECKAGEIGVPDSIRKLPNAGIDLGLALFKVAERFGARFGDDTPPVGGAPPANDQRSPGVDCALRIVRMVATDPAATVELRANAEYLTGNLEFLRAKYEDAVTGYDAALKLSPASSEKDDTVGGRAAWNRAIALRRIEEQKKPDAGKPPDNHPDGGNQDQDGGKPKNDESSDAGQPKNDDKKNDDKKKPPEPKKNDKNQGDQDKKKDDGKDKGSEPKPQGQKNQPSLSQDERMLDQLEQAPTVQQEAAKKNATRSQVSGMEDK